jgi:hypothetical protein
MAATLASVEGAAGGIALDQGVTSLIMDPRSCGARMKLGKAAIYAKIVAFRHLNHSKVKIHFKTTVKVWLQAGAR